MGIKDEAKDATIAALKGGATVSALAGASVLSAGVIEGLLFSLGLSNPVTAPIVAAGTVVAAGTYGAKKYKRVKASRRSKERAERLRKAAEAMRKHGIG